MWKEVVVAYFQILSCHLYEGTEQGLNDPVRLANPRTFDNSTSQQPYQ